MKKALIATLMAFAGTFALASDEVRTASVISPWEGEGTIYMTDPNTAKLMGVFKGIMFVQTGHRDLIDALPFFCPSTQVIKIKSKTSVTNGDCQIGAGEDIIFAAFECSGPIGGCEGTFKLRGGTGKFAKISGGSTLSSRTETGALQMDESSGIAVKSVKGMFVLPELTYKVPTVK